MMDNLTVFLNEGYSNVRQLSDGRWIGIRDMMYTTGLFVNLNKVGYEYRYCYENFTDAAIACDTWNGIGDPPGPWIKQKPSNRLNPALAQEDFGEKGTT
jgi:hypothetical protein